MDNIEDKKHYQLVLFPEATYFPVWKEVYTSLMQEFNLKKGFVDENPLTAINRNVNTIRIDASNKTSQFILTPEKIIVSNDENDADFFKTVIDYFANLVSVTNKITTYRNMAYVSHFMAKANSDDEISSKISEEFLQSKYGDAKNVSLSFALSDVLGNVKVNNVFKIDKVEVFSRDISKENEMGVGIIYEINTFSDEELKFDVSSAKGLVDNFCLNTSVDILETKFDDR